MPPTTRTTKTTTATTKRPPVAPPVVVTMGCPSGIGAEVVLGALHGRSGGSIVIVGDRGALMAGARALGLEPTWMREVPTFQPGSPPPRLSLLEPGPSLAARERAPGRPSTLGGAAQLAFIEAGFALAKQRGWALVTGPVSKEVIARSGARRARSFRGHTEWLEKLDGAPYTVMCFSSPKLVTSLVTTHVPLAKVARRVSAQAVMRATVELADLVLRQGKRRPRIAVCSFNPHAGEGELLGREEVAAIAPGIAWARQLLSGRVEVHGPIGAETAFRKGVAGSYDAVVGIYHDQVTIPMKLLDFGGAVNVTQGLSIVRTSVDHGTAYDIAGRGRAASDGMTAAIAMARQLSDTGRHVHAETS